jgi:hypothetical protein
MDDEHVAARSMEPGQDEDLVTDPQVSQRLAHIRVEDEPGFGAAFEPLLRGLAGIHQRRLDPPDRSHRIRALLVASPIARS